MKRDKQKRLQAAGWAIGSAKDFLGMTAEEVALVDLKIALARGLKRRRVRRGMTQNELAQLLETSQSRVANMEAGHRTVTIDLLVRSLLKLGFTRRELARIIDAPIRKRAA